MATASRAAGCSEPPAGDARARTRYDLLGCKFLQRAKGVLPGRRASGGILQMAHRQILEGIDLDGQDATPRS